MCCRQSNPTVGAVAMACIIVLSCSLPSSTGCSVIQLRGSMTLTYQFHCDDSHKSQIRRPGIKWLTLGDDTGCSRCCDVAMPDPSLLDGWSEGLEKALVSESLRSAVQYDPNGRALMSYTCISGSRRSDLNCRFCS